MCCATSFNMPGLNRVYTEKHQLDHLPMSLMTSSLLPAASNAHAPPIRSECVEYSLGSAPIALAAFFMTLATVDLLIVFDLLTDVRYSPNCLPRSFHFFLAIRQSSAASTGHKPRKPER